VSGGFTDAEMEYVQRGLPKEVEVKRVRLSKEQLLRSRELEGEPEHKGMPEVDDDATRPDGEKYWRENYPGTLECAHWYRDLLARFYVIEDIRYGSTMISIYVGGRGRIWVRPRKKDRASIEVSIYEGNVAEMVEHLTREGMAVKQKNDGSLDCTVDLQQLKEKKEAHEWLPQRVGPPKLMPPKSYTSRGLNWLILEGLELEGQQRLHLLLVRGRQAAQARVDGLGERLVGRLGTAAQTVLLDELPQPLDQVEVGRVARQEQQLDPQRPRQALHQRAALVAGVVQHQGDRHAQPSRGHPAQQVAHGGGVDVA